MLFFYFHAFIYVCWSASQPAVSFQGDGSFQAQARGHFPKKKVYQDETICGDANLINWGGRWHDFTSHSAASRQKKITHSENENSDSFFLSFLYFSSLSLFNTLLLPPLSAQLSVSLTLTWYLTPQMVQRRTHSSLHLLRSSDRTDSYVPSQHTVVGAHLRGASAQHTLCRTQRCARLCEKAFRTHKCPVVS